MKSEIEKYVSQKVKEFRLAKNGVCDISEIA